jgi:hypothetical protein
VFIGLPYILLKRTAVKSEVTINTDLMASLAISKKK